MKVQVRLRGVESTPAIIEYAMRRIHQHLSRFGRQVSGVTVRISDVNGPKGGDDKRCQLTASVPRLGSVNLAETHADVLAGIDLALDRLAHVIGRSLERAREPINAVESRRVT
jgi:putative sigma-54 modulation protein